jgi:hypothetical protein
MCLIGMFANMLALLTRQGFKASLRLALTLTRKEGPLNNFISIQVQPSSVYYSL